MAKIRQPKRRLVTFDLMWFDMVRSARRERHFFFRCLYALALLTALLLTYVSWFGWSSLFASSPPAVPPQRIARFSENLFFTFVLFQSLAVAALTPALTVGIITEEEDRKTLDLLLTTDLTEVEIVLSKLLARIASLGLLLLTALPLVTSILLFGGIGPLMVLAGFLTAAMETWFLACVNTRLSAAIRTDNRKSSLWAQGYLLAFIITGVFWIPWNLRFGSDEFLLTLVLFSCASAVLGIVWITEAAKKLRYRGDVPQLYGRWSAPEDLAITEERPTDSVSMGSSLRIGNHALLWKEMLHGYRKFLPPGTGTGSVRGLDPVSKQGARGYWKYLAPLALIGFLYILLVAQPVFGDIMVHVFGLGVAFGPIFLVVLSASSRISREREQQTLESLLTTPFEKWEIVIAKWLGSLWSVRSSLWPLAAAWLLAAASYALHPASVILLAAVVAVYAGFGAALGLWFSCASRTSLQATLRTVATLLVVFAVGWVVALPGKQMWSWLPDRLAQGVADFQFYGLTFPMPLVVMAFPYSDLRSGLPVRSGEQFAYAVIGLACYAVATWMLLRRTARRLERGTEPW